MKFGRIQPPVGTSLDLGRLLCKMGRRAGQADLERLRQEIDDYFDVRHSFYFSSGKASLYAILSALKRLTNRRKVLIPAYTCFSVPSAVLKAGLEVSLCDVDPETFDYDFDRLKGALDDDTVCVIGTHLFGIPTDVGRLRSLCEGKGIAVVEDAAQSMGGTRNGRKLGTLGDVGFFSLGRGKNITCGSGGIVVTNSAAIAGELEDICDGLHYPSPFEDLANDVKLLTLAVFIRPVLYWIPSGLPFLRLGETFFYSDFPVKRLSPRHALLLRDWRDMLEMSNGIRKANSEYFIGNIDALAKMPTGIPYLRLPIIIREKDRYRRIYEESKEKGLGLEKMYPCPINEIKELGEGYHVMEYPRAKGIASGLLTIPTHPFLTDRDRERICRLLH